MDKNIIITEIIMYSESEGGRPCMPTGSGYSPYFIVEGESDNLAVIFTDVPKDAKPDIKYKQIVELRYPNTVNYSALKKGVEFKVIEGQRIIGKGVVTKDTQEINNAT